MFIFNILISAWKAKQELLISLWSTVFDATLKFLSFAIANWRVILKWLMVLAILAYVIALRDNAVHLAGKLADSNAKNAQILKQQADEKAEIAKLVAKREAEIKLNQILAQKKTDAEAAKHKAQLSLIISKGKKNETLSNSMLNAHRDGMRLAIERENSLRLAKDDEDRLAERDGNAALLRPVSECEAELDVCKEAGAIAAADYNFCKSYVDIQQEKIGVEND